MCLAIPMKILKIENNIAFAEVGEIEYQANLDIISDARVGDYIIVHAGFAIEKLDEETALENLKIWQDIAEFEEKRQQKMG